MVTWSEHGSEFPVQAANVLPLAVPLASKLLKGIGTHAQAHAPVRHQASTQLRESFPSRSHTRLGAELGGQGCPEHPLSGWDYSLLASDCAKKLPKTSLQNLLVFWLCEHPLKVSWCREENCLGPFYSWIFFGCRSAMAVDQHVDHYRLFTVNITVNQGNPTRQRRRPVGDISPG